MITHWFTNNTGNIPILRIVLDVCTVTRIWY